MSVYELDEARLRHREVLRNAERAAVRHRLLVARRWEKRAAHAARRARQAAQALG